MMTRSIWPPSTDAMNSLKLRGLLLVWNFVEKFHTRTPMTTSAIQKTRLLSVEFNSFLQTP